MTQAEIQAIYQEIETMSVGLETQAPELGPLYYLERVQECRRAQDRVTDLTVKVTRALSEALAHLRASNAGVEIAQDLTTLTEFRTAAKLHDAEADDLRLLSKSLEVRRANLRQMASDVRLMCNLMEVQRGIGAPVPAQEAPVAPPQSLAARPQRANRRDRPTGVQSGDVAISEIAPIHVPPAAAAADVLDIEAFMKG